MFATQAPSTSIFTGLTYFNVRALQIIGDGDFIVLDIKDKIDSADHRLVHDAPKRLDILLLMGPYQNLSATSHRILERIKLCAVSLIAL